MLKTRILPTLLYKNFGLVKGVGFDSSRPIGSLMQAVKVFNMREVDELVFFDIAATLENRGPDFELVDEFADECFMPLTVGGGIRDIEDVRRLLLVGADKVCINTAAVETPDLIGKIAKRFGSQSLVVSIDVEKTSGGHAVRIRSGTRRVDMDPVELARMAAGEGAGEILLTSVDRDGTMQGYDIDITKRVAEAVDIAVIASGGAGEYAHMFEAIQEGGASAIAAAAIFFFTEKTPREAKMYLRSRGVPVRL